MAEYLWLIPVLPLAAAVVTALFGPRFLRHQSHWPCILGLVGACVLSFMVLFSLAPGEGSVESHQRYFTWFAAGDLDVGFSLRADPLTAIMLSFVTFIGSLIAIYAVGYMHDDPGYPRFFAEVALFIFSMTGLVLSDNFIMLYAFWEAVGLCSYLLIGFWFNKPAAAAAARKAFLVNRIGDFGFLLGILLLWFTFSGAVDYDTVFAKAGEHRGVLPMICLLLFCGAVGKSAQFPLHVWLPDAMEGPTPVSALIHAATMVTAGVYMVARCMPLFREATDALLVVACIGGFTALLAALIALTQNDLKRVLAYSTVSQLGYMFLALGCGTTEHLATAAMVAAIFHVFTHAFFKALLFLSAGSVMHAMGGCIDMRRFSGLRAVMPITHSSFLMGALALAGVPLFSGFWSKDDILGTTAHAAAAGNPNSSVYMLLLVIGIATAGLTAFYTFRAYFMTFWGDVRIPEEAGHHAHESPPVMTIPLCILAVGAVGVGIVVEPFTHWFSHFLSRTPLIHPMAEHGFDWTVMSISSVVALGGVGIAWWMYARQPGLADRLAAHMQALYQLSLNKFHLDEIYAFVFVKPLAALTVVLRFFDLQLLDGLVDLLGQIPRLCGQVVRPIQNGLVQFYALAMVAAFTVFLLVLILRIS